LSGVVPLVGPDGRPLPMAYRWVHALGVRSLTPWHLLRDQGEALVLRDEFLIETGDGRDWIPFARDQTCDELAGFALDARCAPTGEVWIVHLTFKRALELPGFPSMERYSDFWDWLQRRAIPDTREWAELASEADLVDLSASR
jgi:hypothetical protein